MVAAGCDFSKGGAGREARYIALTKGVVSRSDDLFVAETRNGVEPARSYLDVGEAGRRQRKVALTVRVVTPCND